MSRVVKLFEEQLSWKIAKILRSECAAPASMWRGRTRIEFCDGSENDELFQVQTRIRGGAKGFRV